MHSLPKHAFKQELCTIFGLCIQLMQCQRYQHHLLTNLMEYQQTSPASFQSAEFHAYYNQTMRAFQQILWTSTPWTPSMRLDMYIVASALGFAVILSGNGRIVLLCSISNPQAYHHSSTIELEGLVRSLRDSKQFFY